METPHRSERIPYGEDPSQWFDLSRPGGGSRGLALDNLKGWGALVADAHRRALPAPAPNLTRWGHVGNVDQLAAELTAGRG